MNVTFHWNTTEEALGHLFLGGLSLSLHGYALFLCSAIFDYQDEKPILDKSPFDALVQDLMRSQFWTLYGLGKAIYIRLTKYIQIPYRLHLNPWILFFKMDF